MVDDDPRPSTPDRDGRRTGPVGQFAAPIVLVGLLVLFTLSEPVGVVILLLGGAVGIYAALRPDTDRWGRPLG